MGILTGEASLLYIYFATLLHVDKLFKERICSERSKFFTKRVYPIWKGFFIKLSKEANKKSQKLFPFVEMGENYRDVPIHHKMLRLHVILYL